MHYHKHKMREKKKKRRRSTSHWPCVPDVQSDEINTIGFIYIYSYIDIEIGRLVPVVIFMLCLACLYVYTCIHSLLFIHTHTHIMISIGWMKSKYTCIYRFICLEILIIYWLICFKVLVLSVFLFSHI